MDGIGSSFQSVEALCTRLQVRPADFMGCAHNLAHHVRKISKAKPDGSIRTIYAPSDKLKTIQRAIKDVLLATFDYPDYVYGLGGDTLRQHAEVHAGDNTLVKVDIRDFFPSISYTKVYEMWVNEFSFRPEIARFLTKLTTHAGYLQQGFPTSSHIAAITSIPVTSALKTYSNQNGLNFSQYVDDLNFSGPTPNYRDMFKVVISVARENGFCIKPKKTQVYGTKTGKLITGVSLNGSRTRAPRKIRKRAIDALKIYGSHPDDPLGLRRAQGYAGFLGQLDSSDGHKYKEAITHARHKSGPNS